MTGLDKEGFAVNDDGERIKDADGEEIQIEGAKTQEDIDRVAKGLQKEIKTLRLSKKELEAKGAKVEELESLIAQKEQEVDDAASAAAVKVGEEMDGLKTENQRLKTDATMKAINNALLSNAGAFVRPEYLMNMLHGKGSVGENGSVQFRVMIEEDGKQVDKSLSAKDAAAHIAETHPALVKSTKDGGSGTQNDFAAGTQKRSEMNREQKAAYIKKHSAAAFQKLPD